MCKAESHLAVNLQCRVKVGGMRYANESETTRTSDISEKFHSLFGDASKL
jgi:hypothetical protein